jgi:phenylalanyl-tRNA synthetase beta chain
MISISPAVENLGIKENLREKISNFLVGKGFTEILTNSITNSKYYDEAESVSLVKMINNLSADLDAMRPSMLETGLETIAYNINRRQNNLQLFEFGKTYLTAETGFIETEHFSLLTTGNLQEQGWRTKTAPHDFYAMKGLASAILQWCGLAKIKFEENLETPNTCTVFAERKAIATIVTVATSKLKQFDIKQPVYQLNIPFEPLLQAVAQKKIVYKEVNKFPLVQRDLALVVNKSTPFTAIEKAVQQLNIKKLQQVHLFDVFESDKLGADKKSMAVNFTFADDAKTLTDTEIDGMMNKLIQCFEKEINAEIRK